MDGIIEGVIGEIRRLSAAKGNTKDYSRFDKGVKEGVHLSTPLVRKVSSRFFPKGARSDKERIFGLCEALLETKDGCARTIAFDWAFRIRKLYSRNDFGVFERWLGRYVDSWGSCDDLCTHALGYLIFMFPDLSAKARLWARSRNRWVRRAAAVALIYSLRRGRQMASALAVEDALLHDNDDTVQKGCGWMLKEADRFFHAELIGYLVRRRTAIPRVTLRYATEKMPQAVRARLLA